MEISVDTAVRFITTIGLFYLGSMMGVLNHSIKGLKEYISHVDRKLDKHMDNLQRPLWPTGQNNLITARFTPFFARSQAKSPLPP